MAGSNIARPTSIYSFVSYTRTPNVISPVMFSTWLPKQRLPLQWRHNEHDGVSNHPPHIHLLNRLFRHRSKKTSKLRVTGLLWGEFSGDRWIPAQRASNAENVSIWWRHHNPFVHWPIEDSVVMLNVYVRFQANIIATHCTLRNVTRHHLW